MKVFFALAIGALFSATIVAQPALAQSMPTGSWTDSCRNAYVHGSTFSAQCRNDNDAWVNSSIDFSRCQNGSVSNQNGSLVCEASNNSFNNGDNNGYQNGNNRGGSNHFANLPPGSWSNSCVGARMKNDVLRANCQTGHGYNRTSYTLSQCQSGALLNNGGNLQCDNAYQSGNRYRRPINYSSQLPSGNWSDSCRNGSMNGTTLNASCQQFNGSYRTSSVDVSRCYQDVVSNNNGQLVCQSGQR